MTRLSLRSTPYFLPVALMLTVLMALLVAPRSNAEKKAYFGEALSAAKARETVTVGGKTFMTADGQITSESGRMDKYSVGRDAEIMRLAYAKTLARRNPLLALEGVDIPALESAIARLNTVRVSLAELHDGQDKESLLSGLYPTQFLAAAVTAEKARRAFLAEGSAVRERQYNSALKKTIDAYAANLQSYKAAYLFEVPDGFGLLTTIGAVTKQSTVRTIELLEDRGTALRAEFSLRNACTSGVTERCDVRSIRFSTPHTTSAVSTGSQTMPALSREILGMLTGQGNEDTSYSVVALVDSVCVSETQKQDARYFILKPQRSEHSFPASMFYIGDLFFVPISSASSADAPTIQDYMRDLGVTYQPYDPSKFYICPGIAVDYSKAYGSIAAKEFVEKRLDTSTVARPIFSEDAIHEADVLRFLHEYAEGNAATPSSLTQKDANDLTAIYLGLRQNTFGFEHIVEQVAHVAEGEVQMYRAGVPIRMSPDRLLAVISGFPSLFLAFSHNVPGSDLRVLNTLFSSTTTPSHRITIWRWSETKNAISRDEAVRNLDLFRQMHQSFE